MAIIEVRSEIAGTVLGITAQAGEVVKATDILIMLEAMKMEIPAAAPCAGIVLSIDVIVGELVDENQLLATLQA